MVAIVSFILARTKIRQIIPAVLRYDYAELLLRSDLSDEARGYAHDIKQAGKRSPAWERQVMFQSRLIPRYS